MNALYDPKAPKKACNVSINADLLAQAKALGINLSQLLESELESRLREAKAAAWAEENKAAIAAHNAHVEKFGLWSDGARMF
ncbi:type II toxin-antitoxin system CcdA family antitoxin [Magnetospirillum moscoviense]|uniref:Acetoacetyl-CoA synthase n=1 Tax=Magnetospirillum moscoviense TaxID=1437059 RepID=A0A178MLD0_9PROT|nr:type II toxin-antitoxin system CcdA family antitoxin [Magnetospirillum moscoviense]OAN49353.1 acetoacetyl-CoA synthase [Magnetospirillum moscoviense]